MPKTKDLFADLALNTKSSKKDDLFTYKVPHQMEEGIAVGQMALAPLGKRKVNGIVVALHNKKPAFATKEIIKIIDPIPLVASQQVELARFISEYYWCGFSLALFSMLPPNLRRRRRELRITNYELRITNKKPKFNIKLNDKQRKALEKIKKAIESKKSQTFLLHGVTASGKTEVYLRAFAEVLKNKGQPARRLPAGMEGRGGGIFIVPEISLTPQTIERFEEIFGRERIAVMHSKLRTSERLKIWQEIKEGRRDIVIGARSAIFAPLPRLKIIIVDEEHDLISFKSDQTPRYELHRVAEKVAELNNAVLIFGTATPLVESYFEVLEGKWDYLSLPERVDGKRMPVVKIVDINKEKEKGNFSLFSDYLLEAMALVLKNKRQTLLFLNRRGMATFVACRDCGEIFLCPRCEIALVYHLSLRKLLCHHCGGTSEVSVSCSKCGGVNIQFLGRGTEKIEEEIKKIFPHAHVARMDRDSMECNEDYHRVFNDFKNKKIDILVGTQMIVHGWDIPSVDLAGIISLDLAVNIPDFRSQEKVFQLIAQLAGRTGRADSRGLPYEISQSDNFAKGKIISRGLLVLQTLESEREVFKMAERGDYVSFVKKELALREKFGYPPYVRLIKLSLSGEDRDKVEKKALDLINKLNHELQVMNYGDSVKIIGPIPPLVPKKYGKWWQNIIIKFSIFPSASSSGPRGNFQFSIRDKMLNLVPKEWVIDVEPLGLL